MEEQNKTKQNRMYLLYFSLHVHSNIKVFIVLDIINDSNMVQVFLYSMCNKEMVVVMLNVTIC